jgi:hypothetical protein
MAMAINAFCPLIELAVERTIENIILCLDKGCKCCSKGSKYMTKQKTMLGYIEARGGVEHELHVKYSEVMTVLFVVLTYGPGVPFMYVIGVIHYFIYYSVARWTLVYTVRRP